VLERLYPEQLDDLAPMLAHHFFRGEDWERAALYSLVAAREAVRIYALREALEHFDRAYQALKHLPNSPPGQLIDTIVSWAELAVRFNRFREAVDRLEEAERLARSLNDRRRLAFVLNWLGNAHVSAGFPSLGMPPLIESHQLAEEVGDDRLTLLPTFLTTTHMVDRNPRAALDSLQHVIELAAQTDRPDIEAHAVAVKAMALSRLGEFSAAEQSLQRAHEVARRVTAPAKLADVNAVSALVYFDMGLIDRGLDYSQTATSKGMEAGVTECTLYSMYCTALGQYHKANLDEARRGLEQLVQMATTLPSTYLTQLFLRGGLAMVQARAAEPGGMDTLKAVRDSARASGDDYMAAVYSQTLGETRLNDGDFEGAERDLGDALAYYRRNQMRPYLVRILRSLAALYERQGRTSEANAARDEADRLQAELEVPASDPDPIRVA
ncbi:MAG TPA: hypothetical protein VF221_13645, partial [Chloroflexota bacterium]